MKRTLILFGLLLGFALHSYPANYYVKMDGEGDGSSWENAMGNERFAETLKSAPDGSTFHIAKGTYYPTYDTTFIRLGEVHSVKVYPIRSQVSIIGGYPEDAVDGAVSEPDKYVTCFSADFGGDDEFTLSASTFGNGMDSMVVSNYEENSPIIFDVYNVKGSLTFRGVEMTGALRANVYIDEKTSKVNFTMSRSKVYNSAGAGVFSHDGSCVVDSCQFINNGILAPYSIGTALYFYGATGCKITNSYFERNGFLNVALNSSGAEFYSGEVSKCTFYKNCSGVGSVLEVVDSLRISNCNFVENYSRAMPCINSFLQLDCCNSIFINNKSYHDEPIFESPIVVTAWEDQSYKIYGNIIIGSKYGVLYSSSYAEHLVNMHCGNNLVFTLPTNGENTFFPNEDDWYYSDEDIATVLDGSYNKATGVFTPKLTADENSFVPYIKLVSDRLPDSTQIRFPLSRSIVSEDQCGQKRYEMTCAGSYEFPLCPTDTTFATDTLIAGEPFVDGVVYYVGRHDSIIETITLPNGCDSVVMHSLIVKPKATDVELVDSENSILYPNPAKTHLSIRNSDCAEYEIYSMDGRLVDAGKVEKEVIRVSHLPNGFYLLRILFEERIGYGKFVKED